jgi:hypothetical protein
MSYKQLTQLSTTLTSVPTYSTTLVPNEDYNSESETWVEEFTSFSEKCNSVCGCWRSPEFNFISQLHKNGFPFSFDGIFPSEETRMIVKRASASLFNNFPKPNTTVCFDRSKSRAKKNYQFYDDSDISVTSTLSIVNK